MYKTLFGAAIAALAFSSPAAAATEIFNEDFETVDIRTGSGTGFVFVNKAGPWTEGPDPVNDIELQYGSVAGDPQTPDGGRVFVELDTDANSSMFYELGMDGTFTLDFLYSPRPNISKLSNVIEVFLDDVLLLTLTGSGSSNTVWTEESTTFSGFAGQNLIMKAAGTSNSFGGYIDNTVLTKIGPVPEPATWLLMILGLGAVGATMRKREKTTARLQLS